MSAKIKARVFIGDPLRVAKTSLSRRLCFAARCSLGTGRDALWFNPKDILGDGRTAANDGLSIYPAVPVCSSSSRASTPANTIVASAKTVASTSIRTSHCPRPESQMLRRKTTFPDGGAGVSNWLTVAKKSTLRLYRQARRLI